MGAHRKHGGPEPQIAFDGTPDNAQPEDYHPEPPRDGSPGVGGAGVPWPNWSEADVSPGNAAEQLGVDAVIGSPQTGKSDVTDILPRIGADLDTTFGKARPATPAEERAELERERRENANHPDHVHDVGAGGNCRAEGCDFNADESYYGLYADQDGVVTTHYRSDVGSDGADFRAVPGAYTKPFEDAIVLAAEKYGAELDRPADRVFLQARRVREWSLAVAAGFVALAAIALAVATIYGVIIVLAGQ